MEHSEQQQPLPLPSAELWRQWREFIHTNFSLDLTDEAVGRFEIYARELLDWNAKMNLVSVRSADEVLWRHFADSLAGLTLLQKHGGEVRRVIDIGTGAGFPGVPVRIARPEFSLTLLESIAKKCSFLEHLLGQLGFADTTLINDRAEIVGQDKRHRASYDVLLSRAVAKFSPNLEIALPLVKKGGLALIYKTERSAFGEEGLDSVKKALGTLGGSFLDSFCYTLPGADQKYCVLAFRKIADTPPAYPRRVGIPEKKPL